MSVVIIMLSGVPKDAPRANTDLVNYLKDALSTFANDPPPIYIAGGATDPSRAKLTEAEAAFEVLTGNLGISKQRITVIPRGIDAREVLEEIAWKLKRRYYREKASEKVRVMEVVCPSTNVDLVRFHVWRLFPNVPIVRIIPITYGNINAPWQILLRRLLRIPRTLLGIAGTWHWKIRGIELWWRKRHMRKMAAFPERLPPST